MLTPSSKAYQDIARCTKHIAEGIVIAIDPSIGSNSSMPGFAVYVAGELQDSGILEIDPRQSVPVRLQRLAFLIRKLYKEWIPDVLVYEDIPPTRFGGGNAGAHSSLLKSVGVVLSVSGPDFYVGIQPRSWKQIARSSYVKGDVEDAEEIGWVVIEEAKRIQKQEEEKSEAKAKKVRRSV
jgi:hypothetical protein